MEFHENGVTVYGTVPGMTPLELTYIRRAVLSDGNWHHIVFNYEFNSGTVRLYLDTVFQGEDSNVMLAMVNMTYR